MNPVIERDERTLAVENAGYRWAWLTMAYGALGLTAWRSFARHESTWDLLGLLVLSGAVQLGYQLRGNVVTPRRLLLTGLTLVIAAVVAVLVLLVRP